MWFTQQLAAFLLYLVRSQYYCHYIIIIIFRPEVLHSPRDLDIAIDVSLMCPGGQASSSVVVNVPLNATKLKRCMQTESFWKRKDVSRLLPVMSEIRLPTAPMNSSANRLNWPKVSIATG